MGKRLSYKRLGKNMAFGLIDQILAGIGEHNTGDIESFADCKLTDEQAERVQAEAVKIIEKITLRLARHAFEPPPPPPPT